MRTAASIVGLLLYAGCATPIPEEAKVTNDTGGLTAESGVCGERTAGVGAAPIERVTVALNCDAPSADGHLNVCYEASLSTRDGMGGLRHYSGLTHLKISVVQPEQKNGRTRITMVPLGEDALLSDGGTMQLTLDVPTDLEHTSLETLSQADAARCQATEQCAFLDLTAETPDSGRFTEEYPLGLAASGVFLIDSIGWNEDPIVLELEVPFFAPESDEATVCDDGLIHYARG